MSSPSSRIQYTIRMFAAAKQCVGGDSATVFAEEGASVGALRRALCQSPGPLAELVKRSLFAVDNRYVDDAFIVSPEMEIACIPPVSGG